MYDEKNIFASLSSESKYIFGLIQKKGPITKNTLVKLTNLNISTLNRIMLPLDQLDLITTAGTDESSGGRKPILYKVTPIKYFVVGIDISRTFTRITITNLIMETIHTKNFPMTDDHVPDITVDQISETLDCMLHDKNIDKTQLLGVGLGTVGPINNNKTTMLFPFHFPSNSWNEVPIKKLLESKLQLKVFIENGANTAVLSEYHFGHGKNFDSVAYFNCGVGIRSGAILSGKIVKTVNESEDAFGHMIVDVDGDRCSCGNFGCIECYASILSITKKFVSEIKKGRSSSILKDPDEITYEDICNAAKENDLLSKEIITNAAVIFGTGLSNYINLFNPDIIILSGPLIINSELFYDISINTAQRKSYPKKISQVIFKRIGYFGDNTIATGAAAMTIEEFLSLDNLL